MLRLFRSSTLSIEAADDGHASGVLMGENGNDNCRVGFLEVSGIKRGVAEAMQQMCWPRQVLYNFASWNGCTTNPRRGKCTLASMRAGVSSSRGLMTTSSGDRSTSHPIVGLLSRPSVGSPNYKGLYLQTYSSRPVSSGTTLTFTPDTSPIFLSRSKCGLAGVGSNSDLHFSGLYSLNCCIAAPVSAALVSDEGRLAKYSFIDTYHLNRAG
jgi:hypothetical protein